MRRGLPVRGQLQVHHPKRGQTTIDPALLFPDEEGFAILLTNSSGAVYRGELFSGDLVLKGRNRYTFRDRTAKYSPGVRDGISSVRIRVNHRWNQFWYSFKVKVFADLSSAIEPDMTVQASGMNDVATRSGGWSQTRQGWRLRDF